MMRANLLSGLSYAMQPILNIALRAARQSSEYLVQAIDRREPATSSQSTDLKLLAHLDDVIYNALYDAMKRAHPTHFIHKSDEQPRELKDDAWEVQSIASPNQLLRKLPDTAFAFVHRHKGKTQNVVVVNPMTGEEFTASRGNGATLNSRRIRCTDQRALEGARIHTNLPNQLAQAHAPHVLQDLMGNLFQHGETHVSGCDLIDLCRVAAGQADALLSLNVALDELDAAMLIARESGLLTGSIGGNILAKQKGSLIAANPKLFKNLVQRYGGWENKLH